MTAQQSAVSEWARQNGENPNLSYDDLNAAEKAQVDAIVKRNKDAQDKANRKGNGGINISLPFTLPNVSLKIPCPRPGNVIPNPRPPPSVPTPDIPNPGDTSTNGGTNRIPIDTNTNPIIRTNPSSVNTNDPSTNRTTNGNGRGGYIGLRGGFAP